MQRHPLETTTSITEINWKTENIQLRWRGEVLALRKTYSSFRPITQVEKLMLWGGVLIHYLVEKSAVSTSVVTMHFRAVTAWSKLVCKFLDDPWSSLRYHRGSTNCEDLKPSRMLWQVLSRLLLYFSIHTSSRDSVFHWHSPHGTLCQADLHCCIINNFSVVSTYAF